MKIHPATSRDTERDIMRLELNAKDIETIHLVVDRLYKLLVIERELGVVAMQAMSIFGEDLPTITAEGIKLLEKITTEWYGDYDDLRFVLAEESDD